jgi:hypothetical protein
MGMGLEKPLLSLCISRHFLFVVVRLGCDLPNTARLTGETQYLRSALRTWGRLVPGSRLSGQ